jgi:uncharacterized membrane protein YraQ (UPF0718 family)
MDIVKIFFMLALIIYFMGLLRFHISPEKVRDYLQGKSKYYLYKQIIETRRKMNKYK